MHRILSSTGMTDWLSTWRYLGIFICIFTASFGIPIPEELVLLVGGVLAGRHTLHLSTLYPVAIISAAAGDSCGFLVGRMGGRQVFEWLEWKLPFVRRRHQYLQMFFQAHGNSAVFFARFLTGARFMAGPMAGAAGMPFSSFLVWNVLGACVWCSLIVTLGYLVGDQLDWVLSLVKNWSHWIAAVGFMAAVTIWLSWRRKRHHLRLLT